MKILHYLLGFPPVRSGGLVKYVIDLALGEQEQGCEVSFLVAGKKGNFKNYIKIKQTKEYEGITSYEIQNALPIPIDGVKKIDTLIKPGEKQIFLKFLEEKKFDIIHVHSFMGLYKEFLLAAKELNIPIVYTTHDYYGICPKVNLYKNGTICSGPELQNCSICCIDLIKKNNLSICIYKKIVGIEFIKNLLQNDRIARVLTRLSKDFEEDSKKQRQISQVDITENYKMNIGRLNKYYNSMFQLIDMFMFNSIQTEDCFKDNIKVKNGKTIDITHRDIKDNRQKKIFEKKLKISYLGSIQPIKGFDILKDALDDLYKTRKNFELNVFFATRMEDDPYIKYHKPYTYDIIEKIMMQTDLIVVPSMCKETFGFVVKEAISFGVPCIITENVGAKEWLNQFVDIGIVRKATKKSLLQTFVEIYDNREILERINENILNMNYDFSFSRHVVEVMNLYYRLVEKG